MGSSVADGPALACDGGSTFELRLKVEVRDAALLWRMAAAHALAVSALEMDDIEDVIGPMEDPSLADCLAMLLVPQGVAGCALSDARIECAPAQRTPAPAGGKPRRSAQPLTAQRRVARPMVPR